MHPGEPCGDGVDELMTGGMIVRLGASRMVVGKGCDLGHAGAGSGRGAGTPAGAIAGGE